MRRDLKFQGCSRSLFFACCAAVLAVTENLPAIHPGGNMLPPIHVLKTDKIGVSGCWTKTRWYGERLKMQPRVCVKRNGSCFLFSLSLISAIIVC